MLMKRTVCLSLLAIIAALLTACRLPPAEDPRQTIYQTGYTYADLRLLDPADAPDAAQDLIAVYIHRPSGRLSPYVDIRLDFLDISIRNQSDIYIVFDHTYGGNSQLPVRARADLDWDTLLVLPSAGEIVASDSRGQTIDGLPMRVIRDAMQDSLDIRLDISALLPPSGSLALLEFKLQVFVTPAGSDRVADLSAVARSFDPPPRPAYLLLAFWNTYPAYTPAQALRRWDGAHTGPSGGRHGLSNLLRTAQNNGVPVTLLDLKYSAWLSALDYGGDLESVKQLYHQGIIFIPEAVPPADDPAWQEFSARLSTQFGFPREDAAYTQSIDVLPAKAGLLFVPYLQPSPVSNVYSLAGQRLLPIPQPQANQPGQQPDLNGLSIGERRWLVDSAVQGRGSQIVILGGDLVRSTWGDPQAARAAFDYIRTHPWIHPLYPKALLSMSTDNQSPIFPQHTPPLYATLPGTATSSLLAELATDQQTGPPPNPLILAAAQAYLALAPPSTPAGPGYTALQEIYAHQIDVLLSAADWAQEPEHISTCSQDIDRDGQPECVLASERIYTVIQPQIGALTHAFAVDEQGVHQWIAPTSQLTFGTGDPTSWEPHLDLAADPQVIPGAFYDGGGPYQLNLSDQAMVLSDPLSGLEKTFTLLPDGLRVEYRAASPKTVRLPLVLDPWQRFEPGWAYRYRGAAELAGWYWQLSDGSGLRVMTAGQVQFHTFSHTRDMMNRVENPNAEFPPGHYLPFPLAVLEVVGDPDIRIEIRVSP